MRVIYVNFLLFIFSVMQSAFGTWTVTASTNKQYYLPGEQIVISITATGSPSLLQFSSGCQVYYVMDNVYDSSDGIVCIQIPTSVTLPHTWTKTHDWSKYSPGTGTHYIIPCLYDYPDYYYSSNIYIN